MHILLFMAWPVTNIHRFWNNRPVNELDLFLMAEQSQDIQWYVYHTGLMLSALMVVGALLIYFKYGYSYSAKAIYLNLIGLFAVILLDIVNYWLFAGHSDRMLYAQSGVILLTGITTYITESNGKVKSNHRYGATG